MNNILDAPALVLNKYWLPIHVTTVHRALIMLWCDTAKVVCSETYQTYAWDEWVEVPPVSNLMMVRTGKLKFRVPDVVRLDHFSGVPNRLVSFTRMNLFKRDHYTCQYCYSRPGRDVLTVDHVVPRSRGGSNTWTNCVAAGASCNMRKADRTPEEAGMHLRSIPVRPDWRSLCSDRTSIGRNWEPFFRNGATTSVYSGA